MQRKPRSLLLHLLLLLSNGVVLDDAEADVEVDVDEPFLSSLEWYPLPPPLDDDEFVDNDSATSLCLCSSSLSLRMNDPTSPTCWKRTSCRSR